MFGSTENLLHCLATVKLSTYRAFAIGKDVPVVHIGLVVPASEPNGESKDSANECQVLDDLEFEGELALDIWNYVNRRWALQKSTSGISDQLLVINNDVTARQQAEQELSESKTLLRALYKIATDPLSLATRFGNVLATGCQYFSLDYSFLAKVEGDDFEVIAVQTPDNSVAVGEIFDVNQVYCMETLQQVEPLWIPHASASDWCHHSGYASLKMETYFGMRILVNNRVYGVLSFCSKVPSLRQFHSADNELLQLMAQWIGSELQREQALERLRLQEML